MSEITPLEKRALEIIKKEDDEKAIVEQIRIAEEWEALRELTKEFELAFKDEIPLLTESGIKYSLHFQKSNRIEKFSYVVFEKDGKKLKMDFFNKKQYRYEYIPIDSGTYSTLPLRPYSKEDFIKFIYNGLLKSACMIRDNLNSLGFNVTDEQAKHLLSSIKKMTLIKKK